MGWERGKCRDGLCCSPGPWEFVAVVVYEPEMAVFFNYLHFWTQHRKSKERWEEQFSQIFVEKSSPRQFLWGMAWGKPGTAPSINGCNIPLFVQKLRPSCSWAWMQSSDGRGAQVPSVVIVKLLPTDFMSLIQTPELKMFLTLPINVFH